MVSVTSVLAPRLSRLIVDADLDMKGYGILNAVLKAGNKLGADLDAQGKTVINAALSGAKLVGPLDAAGNKITNLVHDDTDPTSGATMAALMDAIYPSILYDKYLCWGSESPPPLLVSGYTNGPRRILNIKPDYGVLYRTNVVETANTILYQYDLRHSHDLDTHDWTVYSAAGDTPKEVFRIDYGDVLSVKELYMIISMWPESTTGRIYGEISVDGDTWTGIWGASNGYTSEAVYRVMFRDLTFRYLRFKVENVFGYNTYARIRKIVITI